MNKTLHLAIFASILISLCSLSHAQTCQNHKFSNQNTYTKCIDLPLLKSFLHWNFTESSSRLDLAFRHVGTIPSEWIAWAINPQGLKMIGSQALVAYQRLDGPFRAYTSPVYSYNTELPEGKLSFTVSALSATFENGEKTIFASLQLPYNTVTINQVWQNGLLNGNAPAAHTISPDNLHSCGTLNLITGAAN